MNAKNNKYQRLHRNETEIQLHMCIRIGYRKKIHIYSFAIIQMNTKTAHEKCKKTNWHKNSISIVCIALMQKHCVDAKLYIKNIAVVSLWK